jgi:hypothetical protein
MAEKTKGKEGVREGMKFCRCFNAVTGHAPFHWQCRLHERFARGDVPVRCDLPTGLGKTSVIPVWAFALAQQVASESENRRLPRRLVYIVDRRAVVDQATDEVEALLAKLRQWATSEECPELHRLARAFLESSCEAEGEPFTVSTLRGQHADNRRWLEDPSATEALRWLERQPPPTILAPEAVRQRDHLVNYLPNNDDKFKELDNAGYDRSHVRSAEKSLGAWFFPIPSTVTFRWDAGRTPEERRFADVLCAMARLVTYLGRTGDSVLVLGQILETAPAGGLKGCRWWQPHEHDGGRWLAPAPGFLDLLNRRFPRSVSSVPPDFTNTRQVDYAAENEARFDYPIAVFEMLRLDADKKLAFAPRHLRQPAGMVRDAMLQWAAANPALSQHFGPDRMARLLQGHKSAASREPKSSRRRARKQRWTADEDALPGRLTDREVAEKLNRTLGAV